MQLKLIFKKITKSKQARRVLAWFSYMYIKLAYQTSLWQIKVPEEVDLSQYISKPALYAFWHGRLAMMPYLAPSTLKMNVLISNHSDGEIIAIAMHHFGFGTISGSSYRKGSGALRQIIKKSKMGENIAITPDGSRGPRMRVNGSIIDIARIAKMPIIPISFATKNCRIFNSWDRFMLPLPFSKGILIYGTPITIPDHSDTKLSWLNQELELELNKITEIADKLMGLEPVKAAPIPQATVETNA
jgi:hypothetical protein